MAQYPLRDVVRLLGLSRSTILGLVRAGFVAPLRGPRRQYLFSFQDLVVLRAARSLAAANVPTRRIARSLRALRCSLPDSVPLSGLRFCAVGDRVVVSEGRGRWQADSGQYLLDFEVYVEQGQIAVRSLAGRSRVDQAEPWFERGAELEETGATAAAREAYERALEIDPDHVATRINLGRLLYGAGLLTRAEQVYRGAGAGLPRDPLLLFNLAILLEDLGRAEEAIAAYRHALRKDPRFADCHYNLSLAYQAAGNVLGAVRHMRVYRSLVAG